MGSVAEVYSLLAWIFSLNTALAVLRCVEFDFRNTGPVSLSWSLHGCVFNLHLEEVDPLLRQHSSCQRKFHRKKQRLPRQ